jgi:hypothetical protein
LLTSQMERLKVGRLDSRTVLETEEKLFEARIAELENMVQYQKAWLEMELVTGSTLVLRNLDTTKPQLQARTTAYLQGRLSDAALEKYSREAAKQYYEDLSPNSLTTRKALDTLHQELKNQDLENERKAVETLRKKIDDMEAAPGHAPAPSAAGESAPKTAGDTDAQRKALELLREQMQSTPAQTR